jgi:hypothetical protein
MSYYPKQYPVLDRRVWTFDTPEQFRPGEFRDAVLSDQGPQVAPTKQSGVYVSPVVDAGQAVAWKVIAWRAEVVLGSSVLVRSRFGATEEECLSARWSAPYPSSPAPFSLSASRELSSGVAAARFVQVRVQMNTGTGGSPTLTSIRLNAELVPPACVGPINQGIVEDGKPVLYWTRVEGAASYAIEMSTTPDFSEAVFHQDGLSDTVFAYPREIKPGHYYWRVCAIDGTGHETAWSPVRSFTVGGRPTVDPAKLRHPYLFFAADEIPAIREKLLSKHASTWAEILRRADEALDAEIPDEKEVLLAPGQHGNFHPLAGQVARGQLEPLAFAYLITEDERYAARAREVILRLVGMSRWTGVPFGNPGFFYPAWQAALETAGMCKGVATAYDWLYHYLTEDERAAVRAGLLRLGVLPIVESWSDPRTIRFVPRHQVPSGNWWSVCNSGGGIGALALLPDVPDARRWIGMIADAIRGYLVYPGEDFWNVDVKAGSGGQYVLKTYPNWGEDGGYVESLGYLDYGLTNALYFIDALKRVTGEDLAPFVNRKLIDQPFYFLCRSEDGTVSTVNFNDSGRVNLSDDFYALLAKHTGSQRASYLLRASYPNLKNIHAALAVDDSVEPETPDPSQANKLMRDIGWCVFRDGWGEDASLIAAKFKHGRGHQDIGQFVVHYRGYPFIIDPGVVPYADPIYREHLCTSYAHNLVLVDGQCQLRVDGKVLGYAEIPGAGIVEADLTPAYQDLVSSWTRTLIFLGPDSFVVVDRLRSSEERTYTWQIHPNGRNAVQPGVGATIYHDKYEMQLKLVSPAQWRASTMQGYIGPDPAEYLSFEPLAPSCYTMFIGVFSGTERGRNIGVERQGDESFTRIRIITPDATHYVFVTRNGEADMSGWGIATTARTCALTVPKNASDTDCRWLIAGTGPLRHADSILADASSVSEYRAGK